MASKKPKVEPLNEYGYYSHMKAVSVAKLKDQLSRYLEEVERGEEIVVRKRKKPVAIITRFPVEEDQDEQRLVLEGKLRVPTREMDRQFWDRFWAIPAISLKPERLAQIVAEDRHKER